MIFTIPSITYFWTGDFSVTFIFLGDCLLIGFCLYFCAKRYSLPAFITLIIYQSISIMALAIVVNFNHSTSPEIFSTAVNGAIIYRLLALLAIILGLIDVNSMKQKKISPNQE